MSFIADTTLVIMAGGQSARMGVDKIHLMINNIPIVQHLLFQLDWAGPSLLIVPQHYQGNSFGIDKIARDSITGNGPLQGILTALLNTTTNKILMLAVDMPFINPSLISKLLATPMDKGVLCQNNQIIQPFPSIFSNSSITSVSKSLQDGQLSVKSLLNITGFSTVDVSDSDPSIWNNINRPTDITQMQTREMRVDIKNKLT